ncbi:hypothetical protein LGR54_23380 [Ancylobacter sp. Lp-2]|uniref:hypothetical protein n=1 Tax=Ancylobacter sp. Lp-2 TaxID=2881339 RepID=UPI001E35885A|nr:hypothetical protein [Ancylobacter sp. Lp-2]MCB4771557.1 hypothetical protein [Ancylobacter sp. Lp-2]
MTEPHPSAVEHLPFFITAPGGTDVLMIIAVVTLVGAVLLAGVFFLTVHSLPERLAHKGQKLQFEFVAVLCLLALFTHSHVLWVAALLLAFIDLPDFLAPLNRIARASEKLADLPSPPDPAATIEPHAAAPHSQAGG